MKDSPIKILIVDDDYDDFTLISEALSQQISNSNILHAENGIKALQLLENTQDLPHLVILDINMPVMDGRKTLDVLQGHSKFSSIPVVVLTTSTSEIDKAYFENKHVAMLVKPWSAEGIRETVQNLLGYLPH